MSPPPVPEDWRRNWHLVAHLDQLAGGGSIDVVVVGVRARIEDDGSGVVASGEGRTYPVMVVDDEIFMLLGDEPA